MECLSIVIVSVTLYDFLRGEQKHNCKDVILNNGNDSISQKQ